ncbi:MAG: hypothetical protein ACLSB9_26530 [Hydrogeniiclostridium mannosilyticum]
MYIVSSLGVTGTRSEIRTDLASIVEVVRQNTKTPAPSVWHLHAGAGGKMAGIADGAMWVRPSSSCWNSTARMHRSTLAYM